MTKIMSLPDIRVERIRMKVLLRSELKFCHQRQKGAKAIQEQKSVRLSKPSQGEERKLGVAKSERHTSCTR